MKKQDFEELVESIRQAGRIRRGEAKPSRVTEFATVVQQELSRVAGMRVEAAPRHAIVRSMPRVVRGNVREG